MDCRSPLQCYTGYLGSHYWEVTFHQRSEEKRGRPLHWFLDLGETASSSSGKYQSVKVANLRHYPYHSEKEFTNGKRMRQILKAVVSVSVLNDSEQNTIEGTWEKDRIMETCQTHYCGTPSNKSPLGSRETASSECIVRAETTSFPNGVAWNGQRLKSD